VLIVSCNNSYSAAASQRLGFIRDMLDAPRAIQPGDVPWAELMGWSSTRTAQAAADWSHLLQGSEIVIFTFATVNETSDGVFAPSVQALCSTPTWLSRASVRPGLRPCADMALAGQMLDVLERTES
jgi:hypothetical protein